MIWLIVFLGLNNPCTYCNYVLRFVIFRVAQSLSLCLFNSGELPALGPNPAASKLQLGPICCLSACMTLTPTSWNSLSALSFPLSNPFWCATKTSWIVPGGTRGFIGMGMRRCSLFSATALYGNMQEHVTLYSLLWFFLWFSQPAPLPSLLMPDSSVWFNAVTESNKMNLLGSLHHNEKPDFDGQ